MSFRIFNKNLVFTPSIVDNTPIPYKDDLKPFVSLETTMNNLEKSLVVIELTQSNFVSGTYRIRKSGYYKLTENIVFNPNSSKWDGVKLIGDDWNPTSVQTTGGASAQYPIAPYGPYHLGFFTAITIETNNVILDLNGFTLSQSIHHYLQQRFFSLIELSSSPFISGQGPTNFGSSVIYPRNVKVKNGLLGLTSHQAIHGNGMKSIILEDLSIFNYEQAGIALNGGENIIIRNVCIGKNSHNVFTRATYSQARFVRSFVQQLIDIGNPTIIIQGVVKTGTQILNELVVEMDQVYKDVVIDKVVPTSKLFNNKSMVVDGSIYGIILNVLGAAVNGFITSLDGTSGNKNILLQNININNLISNNTEIVGLSTDSESVYGLPSQKGPVGDVFRILEVSDTNGFYIPDVLSNAQCYISKYKKSIHAGTSSIDEDIYNSWVATPSTQLKGKKYFTCGGDAMAHVMKGNIGLFLSGVQELKMFNTVVENVYNYGELGEVELCQPNTPVYNGNRCRGVVMAASKNVFVNGLKIDTISSKTSDSIGVDFIGENSNIDIQNYNIQNIIQGDLLDSGLYPNISPASILINNATNVVGLNLVKIVKIL
jgi:hypothetical protein